MDSKITKNIDGSWDTSNIKSINDLTKEIQLIKREIKVGARQVKEETKQVPRQAFNATVGKALPFLSSENESNRDSNRSNNFISAVSNPKTLGIAGSIASMVATAFFRKRKRKRNFKAKINTAARGVAVTAALQSGVFLYNVITKWNERRKNRNEINELRVKSEVLKLLKEEQKNMERAKQ